MVALAVFSGKELLVSGSIAQVTEGDIVDRFIGGVVQMELVVSAVTADRIICGPYQFDRKTGAEIDDEFNWGPPPKRTGSYIVVKKT